jgi:hypothetical protein
MDDSLTINHVAEGLAKYYGYLALEKLCPERRNAIYALATEAVRLPHEGERPQRKRGR